LKNRHLALAHAVLKFPREAPPAARRYMAGAVRRSYIVGGWVSARENQPMVRTSLSAFVATVVTVSTFAVSSADAAGRRQYYGYWYGQPSYGSGSLDGRVTGRARTCGHSTFVYDNRGVPTGPYCH
jgi:hypothetical protein